MKLKIALICLATTMLIGCESETPNNIAARKEREELQSWEFANQMQRRQYSDVSNIRPSNRGYILYDIENGSVTCREHSKRSEMSCWANGKVVE